MSPAATVLEQPTSDLPARDLPAPDQPAGEPRAAQAPADIVPATGADTAAGDRSRAVLRVLLAGVAVVAALPHSLLWLAKDYQYGAALGELALIPLCALALAGVAAYRHPWTVRLRGGRADYAAAAVAFAGAMALLLGGPVVAGNHYAVLRPDLLALPLVAVAAVSLLFGVRAVVAFVVPLVVLALSWPLPVRAALEPIAALVAAMTSGTLRGLLAVVPLADVVPGAGDLRLTVAGPQGPFDVLVASACSGVAGIVGMLLVGLCAQYVLEGRRRARLAWLGTAVALAWALNLVRILALLGLGRLLGERVAMDLFHPVAGLVLLNAGMAALMLLARRFGLAFSLHGRAVWDTPLTAPAPRQAQLRRGQRVRRGAVLAAGALVLALVGAGAPGTAAAYAGDVTSVRAFATNPTVRADLELTSTEDQTWAQRYFGEGSAWTRYRLSPLTPGNGYTLWVDSVLTDDWSGLRAHPILDCYTFHDFELVSVSRPTLASGFVADQVVYRRPDGATWHVLSWEWAVAGADGGLAHERVTLLASSVRTDLNPGTAAADDTTGLSGGLAGSLSRRLAAASGGTDPNPALAAALRADADSVIDTHVLSGTVTSEGSAA